MSIPARSRPNATARAIDVTGLSPSEKLRTGGIAYILQDKSVFPGMTVEENLWMGGYLMDQPAAAKRAAEQVFDKYPRLAARRKHPAKVLSGGERRLLEISRALVMEPQILLVDEPSIGLGAALYRRGVRDPARPPAQGRQDHRHRRAERQEGAGIRRHRLRDGVRQAGARRPRRRSARQPRRQPAVPSAAMSFSPALPSPSARTARSARA